MNNPPRDLTPIVLLQDTARLMRRRVDLRARALGLTYAQVRALGLLARDEGASQATLADRLELEPISLCRLVDRLEEGDWVRRQDDPSDRRINRLYLTEKARRLIAGLRLLGEEVQAEALTGLSDDQKARLTESLAAIRANLTRLDAGDAPDTRNG